MTAYQDKFTTNSKIALYGVGNGDAIKILIMIKKRSKIFSRSMQGGEVETFSSQIYLYVLRQVLSKQAGLIYAAFIQPSF